MEKDNVYAKPSPVAGNGLFAKEDVAAGQLLFSKPRPLIAAVDTVNLVDTCSNCFASKLASNFSTSPLALKACAGCKSVKYCSKRCQSQSWKREHKFECPILTAMVARGFHSANVPGVVRALMTVFLRRKNGLMNDEEWESINRMDTRLADMGKEKLESVQALSYGALAYAEAQDMFTVTLAQEMFAKFLTNCLTLTTAALDPVGICLDPLACVANHSCDPNAIVVMDRSKMSFRSLKPIKKDEEIFISYVDNTNHFAYRQWELEMQYHFICNCSKCQQRFDAREDQFKKRADQMGDKWYETAGIVMGATDFADKPANRVSDNMTDPWNRRLSTLVGKAFQDLEKARENFNVGLKEEAIKEIQSGQRLCYQSDMWPLTRQPYASLRDEIIINMMDVGNFNIAWLESVKRYFFVDPIVYPEPHHPVRVVHTLLCTTLALAVGSLDPSNVDRLGLPAGLEMRQVVIGLLQEVCDNIPLSHGADSSLAQFAQSRLDKMRSVVPATTLRSWEAARENQWRLFRTVGTMLEY